MGQLDGQVAVVTGGGSGIGRGVVDRYVEEGAQVAVVDIVQERLDNVATQHGDRTIGILADVTKMEDNQRVVAETVSAFGKLDTFVANAGLGDAFRELVDIPAEDLEQTYREIYDLNIMAVIMGAHAAVAELVKTNGSFIITLSNSSFYPDGGGVMYIGSKHGALGVMRQLAHEFAPHVRVNAVAPGATRTDIRMPASFGLDENGQRIRTHTHPDNKDDAVERVVPLAIHADPEQHSGAYVLLASRRDGVLSTGACIDTDGGLGIRGLRRVRGGDDLPDRLAVTAR